ncbi:galactokinase [Paenibacillus ginsengarvi]|uniref:Galactokinase n=1 Tax=Paenibacillus ginsengarvi TaxID=400777 RepID=A0A3B0CJS5_9BACL|nr:galactokinase [Paenibacillus ginsengarvi]RKN84587.1 galactokinase [Paenibacillus ginsengarvi]
MTTVSDLDIRQLRAAFAERFGDAEGVRLFFAPGRVNLIGEHTDYNGGLVFPAALTFGTYALVKPRTDGLYRFRSMQFEAQADTPAANVTFRKEDDWANYPKGVLSELLSYADGAYAAKLQGADVLYYGNVPNGAGLSSSASIEMATALAFTAIAGLDIPMLELVKLSQRAENRFVGVNCGIMDQFAVGMGKREHAVMLKCDTLDYEYVPFRIEGCKLIITNTNKRRGLADSKYNERRQQCEDGLKWIKEKLPQLGSLGELSLAQWEEVRSAIPDELIRARVEHVVSEDARVLEAKDRLEQGDLAAFGKLMNASHESLRDLYEVTGFELDTLYEVASAIEGCVGTRMTGAGFGGCNVSVVRDEAVDEFRRMVAERYTAKTGLVPSFYVCDIGDGAKELDI